MLERRKQVLDGPLDLVSAQLQKCSKAGAAAILSPPLAFGQPQGPNAGPRLTQSIVFAQFSRFPRRCDVARTYWGSRWRERRKQRGVEPFQVTGVSFSRAEGLQTDGRRIDATGERACALGATRLLSPRITLKD